MDRGRDVMTTVEAINACIPLNNPELTGQLGSLSEIVHYKKGDCIYDIGDIQKKVYVLIEGMLRCYFIDESQTEMTDSFMTEKGMVANSVEIFVGKETPSVVGVEVLNETTVLEIPVQAVLTLCINIREWPSSMSDVCIRRWNFRMRSISSGFICRAISVMNGSAKSGRKSIRSQVISRLLLFLAFAQNLSADCGIKKGSISER